MTPRVDLGPFEFECGESIPSLEVAYGTYGEYDGGNAVLVCHALTGSHRVADAGGAEERDAGGAEERDAGGAEERDAGGAEERDAGNDGPAGDQASAWWDDVVGPGRAIDTDERFVVCANVPGSCYGTTGPASTNPETGEPYGPAFPPVTVGDWTRAQARLLDHLGVEDLRAVVGGSVGGMNVLEWVKRFPDRVEKAVPVATGARLDPQLLGLCATARRAVTSDPAYRGGRYYGDGPDPDRGLAVARRMGHVTYLSKDSMARRFGRRPADRDPATVHDRPDAGDPSGSGGGDPGGSGGRDPGSSGGGDPAAAAAESQSPADPTDRAFAYRDVESYLDYNAGGFVDRFDANSFVYLTRAMEAYDLARGEGSDADALAEFDGEVLLLSFTGDWHFPVERSERLAAAVRRAGVETTHHVVESAYGHDAFLVEPESVGPPIRSFLDGGGPAGTASERAPVHAGLFR